MSNDSKGWNIFMDDTEPEKVVPMNWMLSTLELERLTLLKVMIINALRPERTLYALDMYVTSGIIIII